MNIQTIIQMLIDAGIEEREAKREIKMLLEHFCNYSEKDEILGHKLTDEQLKILKMKVESRIADRTPVQYIIGESYFMGNFFKVTHDVLIPRDETEILVTKAIEIIKENDLKNVLDIGTGSGCIACTIADRTSAVVLGVDISSDALRIALDNVTRLGINNRAVFRKSDLYSKIREDEKFDMIISNPPYIPRGTVLEPELKHEPEIALFADENGLEIYRKIVLEAPKFLNPDGWLIFELGIGEASSVKAFMNEYFEGVTVIKDLAGIDRVIYGKLIG
ncbi:peptide chain release factor N(5)-glutamine methyltransferase [bacterium]|nr:peptide chain release factor N(5)-glutamine methyltransferase [bacterium]